ncbi:LysE family translocator [Shewanella sp. MMG014]|uniref:LysE family translocator n=1 Tax=Shewanella sp. MMG014 TaxID=2822691 RepID=UPI001B37417A|nr:LysE family translocator [Shewanella sp. MMG014]MBQ4888258.1 LysE family translocator [Shewanella sp. MMG014]
MSLESLLTLLIVTGLLLGSPGPVPIALAATGATYGLKQGLPFLLGILVGLTFAITGSILGLSVLLIHYPTIGIVCQIIAAGYMCYIAFKIATAPIQSDDTLHKAPNFRDGFVLNLLNPKAYAAFLAIFSQFLLPHSFIELSYLITGIVCLVVAIVVDSLWLMCGSLLKPVFTHPKHARIIRVLFGSLLVVTVIASLSMST